MAKTAEETTASKRVRLSTYRSVKQEILRRIGDREWERGARIPSEVDLAAEFDCSRGTVNRALRELADAGVVERKRRAGTRVAEDPRRRMQVDIPIVRIQVERRGEAYRYNLLSREVEPAPESLRARLALPEEAELLHLRCLHFADGRPFQFEDRWINPEVVPTALTADLETVGPNEWLVREASYSDGEVTLRAIGAEPAEAELLGTPPGAPVIALERVTWLNDDAVTYVRLIHAPGHSLSLQF